MKLKKPKLKRRSLDLTEPVEPDEADQEEGFAETVALPSEGYEEDKELLELIDDIQATLDDDPITPRVSLGEETRPGR